MKRVVAAILVLAFACASAWAQAPTRVRGTITAIDGNVLTVKSREGKDLRIELAPNVTFGYMKRLSIADIKPSFNRCHQMFLRRFVRSMTLLLPSTRNAVSL